MKQWILSESFAASEEIEGIEAKAKQEAVEGKNKAWKAYITPLIEKRDELLAIIDNRTCKCHSTKEHNVNLLTETLRTNNHPIRRDLVATAKKILRYICLDCEQKESLKIQLAAWLKDNLDEASLIYSTLLYNQGEGSALRVDAIMPEYGRESPMVNGREVLRTNFDYLFSKYPLMLTFGEDTGRIGDVNGGLAGLQDKFGEFRITDTGIRETTIIGQGIGLALRGFRPIAEIQYLDYLLYALQTLSDDLATLHWRTRGGQSAPLIIRTRGHRLEGIWHSGSPMSMILGSLRGIYLCVPRNMTCAAGFYNTLMKSNDPAIVIEPLNGYQLKERMPSNIGEFHQPLGIPEVLKEGKDITLVTYGSCVNIALEAVDQLAEFNISVELIDVQTLLPFDIHHIIAESVSKTNRVVFFDEDLPGGATAYMMLKVLEEQEAYKYLDSKPATISGKEHRPAYSSDGDYFSNPSTEDVFEKIYGIMHDAKPGLYPRLYDQG
jgi:2-oxoisovalerate dehydrogenase E1 component